MQYRFNRKWAISIVILVGIGIFFLPPVYSRAMPRIDGWVAAIKYRINPPDQAVFQPAQQAQIDLAVTEMMQTAITSLTPEVPTVTPTPTRGPTLTPTLSPTPLPASVKLDGFRYEDQKNRWNYCGPANLSMALNFVGWDGDRDDVARAIKPGVPDPKLDFIQQGRWDFNVMPFEMVDFVNDGTEFRALSRLGGDIDLAKRLLAAGFPFIAEKGYYEKDASGKVSWLGHYQFVTGYDDAQQILIVQDTYNDGPNFPIPYDEFMKNQAWLSFANLFIVVYSPERENELFSVLGPYVDQNWAAQQALSMAENHIKGTSGIDSYFAWFAKGTAHVALLEYVDASTAYDQAFTIYGEVGKDDKRPFRMMYYQTGPYWAYFYSGRYLDVINLANITLTENVSRPTLEESIYWRGRAMYMIGNTQDAVNDFREALRLHPNWPPAIQALQDLGFQP